MEDSNPQDQPTPGTQPPDEPGEIGWPAGAEVAYDPSIPEPGSGTAGSSEPPAAVEPTVESPAELEETAEPVVVEQPATDYGDAPVETAEPAVVVEDQPAEGELVESGTYPDAEVESLTHQVAAPAEEPVDAVLVDDTAEPTVEQPEA